jgi:site-specific DNA-methyltransferase (adenine-specific)
VTPYYDSGGVTIYKADALDVLAEVELPELAAVVTDPPYASGGRTEAAKPGMVGMLRGVRWAGKPIENDQMTTAGFVWLVREIAQSVKPFLREGGAFFSFIDWRQWPNLVGAIESVNFRVNGMIVWDKGSFGTGGHLRKQHELICAASKGKPRTESHAVADVLRFKRETNEKHPSPKPAPLMGRLVSLSTARGETVFDPFMGCGPTLVAAKTLGRRAIGVELVEAYCERAAERCEAVR